MIRNSAVLWVGMMAVNVSNYLFHLLMGRFLGPVNYGILASLISILYLIQVPSITIQTVAMKFTADFHAEKEYSRIRTLLTHLNKRLFVVSAALFVLAIIASKPISAFLNIPSVIPIILVSSTLLVAYVAPVNRGILQGLQDFFQLSLVLCTETVLKLLVGLTLVYLGLTVNGALLGIVLGMSVAYLVSFIPLRFLFKEREIGEIHVGRIVRYSIPVFLSFLCSTAYYSVDVILVKHFLPSVEAGYYSGLSILGKIVMFASLAIIGVMFPIVAELHKKDQEHRHYLVYTLALVTAVSGSIVVAYFAAPKLLIRLLFGAKYLSVAPYLGTFGVAMFLLALAAVFINYYLAIHRTSFVYFLVIVAIAQTALIWFFHTSMAEIVMIMLVTMAVLFLGLVAYYFLPHKLDKEPVEVVPV